MKSSKQDVLFHLRQLRISPLDFQFHYRQGRFYDFPTCCIIWYCAFSWCPDFVFNPPVSIWKRLGVPSDRGYVPCPLHYKQSPDFNR